MLRTKRSPRLLNKMKRCLVRRFIALQAEREEPLSDPLSCYVLVENFKSGSNFRTVARTWNDRLQFPPVNGILSIKRTRSV
jgi:hypothetical protein